MGDRSITITLGNKRSYCEHCGYPSSVCICAGLVEQPSPVSIILLQHPNEASHAKNTGRLIKLSTAQCQIFEGEHESDFAECRQQIASADCSVFFPTETSKALESNLPSFREKSPRYLIFIDATWKKALKMWYQNPWLHAFDSWHFESPPKSKYAIRKARKTGQLSTLEALAYALRVGYEENTTPLLDNFATMQRVTMAKHGHAAN